MTIDDKIRDEKQQQNMNIKQQKCLKKQIKTTENQEEKQIKAIKEHGKQPI